MLCSAPNARLAEALAARILEVEGERLHSTHPLLGSAVAARQTPSRRRGLHARLATLAPTAEERARHLALAIALRDVEVISVTSGRLSCCRSASRLHNGVRDVRRSIRC
jgi:hypothetical protein